MRDPARGYPKQTIRTCLLVALSLIAMSAAAIEPGRQLQLRHLLTQDCGSCHGMTLKGGLGPALLPATLEGKSDALLVATILEGRNGTAMPPWRGLLTETEAEYLVELLRSGL